MTGEGVRLSKILSDIKKHENFGPPIKQPLGSENTAADRP